MSIPAPIQTVRDLAGKRALVSGGTSGTGAAITTRLRIAGAHVTATGRRIPEELASDKFIAADITTAEGTNGVIEQITQNGGVDIIVHVAGGGPAPRAGSRCSPSSCGTGRSSSISSERYASIADSSPR